jgi:hypothetical protein
LGAVSTFGGKVVCFGLGNAIRGNGGCGGCVVAGSGYEFVVALGDLEPVGLCYGGHCSYVPVVGVGISAGHAYEERGNCADWLRCFEKRGF